MIDRRRKILLIVLALVLIGGTFLVVRRLSTHTEQPTPSTNIQDRPTISVSIPALSSHLHDLGTNTSTEKTIKSSLSDYLLAEGVSAHTANGIIRESSYKSTNSEGIISINFLVDFNELKRTYRVEIGRDVSSDITTSYVRCPTSTDLIYPAFKCQELE